jgi:hypothetical protein
MYGSKTGVATGDELGTFGTTMLEHVTRADIEKAQYEIDSHISNYNKWIKTSISDIDKFIHNLTSFTSGYDKKIIRNLMAQIVHLEKYAKKLRVGPGKVGRGSVYGSILDFLKGMVPKSYRQKILVWAKLTGRKVPAKYKPFLIKILIALSK